MLEYSFAKVPITRRREGLSLGEDHREIIRAHAANGWEFVQAIPFEGHVEPHLELVFRKGTVQ